MSTLTVWTNAASEVRLHQLTDAHDAIVGYETVTSYINTGTDEEPIYEERQVPIYGPVPYAEQIAHLATLEVYNGWSCVDPDYLGAVPDTEQPTWRWDGSAITSLPRQPSEPTVQQVTTVLQELGMTQDQISKLLAAASAL